jgi:hypothetical protein
MCGYGLLWRLAFYAKFFARHSVACLWVPMSTAQLHLMFTRLPGTVEGY